MGDGAGNPFDKGKGRAHQNGDVLALDLSSAEEGAGSRTSNGFMQMQLIEQQVPNLLYRTPLTTILIFFNFRIHISNNDQQQLNLLSRRLPS
jgi:hypothetical protein